MQLQRFSTLSLTEKGHCEESKQTERKRGHRSNHEQRIKPLRGCCTRCLPMKSHLKYLESKNKLDNLKIFDTYQHNLFIFIIRSEESVNNS